MANKIFNSAVFSGPKFSFFGMNHPNQVSMKMGDCVPIYWDFMNPNDRATFDMSQVVRLSPLLQPILSQIDITVDAFAVRLRSLGMAERDPWVYEDFFNANKNLDGSKMLPSAPAIDILYSTDGKLLGSLYDYLGYPTLDGFRRELRRQLSKDAYLSSSALAVQRADQGVGSSLVYLTALGYNVDGVPLLGADLVNLPSNNTFTPRDNESTWSYHDYRFFDGAFLSGNGDYAFVPLSLFAFWYALTGSFDPHFDGGDGPLHNFLVGGCMAIDVAYTYDEIGSLIQNLSKVSLPDYIYQTYKVDWQSVVEEWIAWTFKWYVLNGRSIAAPGDDAEPEYMRDYIDDIFRDDVGSVQFGYRSDGGGNMTVIDRSAGVIPAVAGIGSIEDSLFRPRGPIVTPLYPALSYWKIVSDWYLNTGLFEPDEYFLQKVFRNGDKTLGYNLSALFGDCFKRNWDNDYFTSAFDTAQRGLAVGIPSDGTIPDLRNANALQKFKERLLFAGHKFRDVIYSIFGIKMSSAIADMSEPLGRWVNPVNIDTTLQTSESTPSSPQASYAGTGLSFGGRRNILRYRAEEPTVIMFVASIRPKYAVYYQGFPRKLRRNYLMDYAIPGFSNVGEQMISNRELYCDINAGESEVFGFTRRFADFMFAAGEVHGDFKDSLDSWHLARQFDESPLLNHQFLSVDPVADGLNRVFATTSNSVDKFYCNFMFKGGIVRSIPKRIYYDL